ncbi:MAG: hypothetical protein ACRD19_01890, partial [Terriglobia bacterium]
MKARTQSRIMRELSHVDAAVKFTRGCGYFGSRFGWLDEQERSRLHERGWTIRPELPDDLKPLDDLAAKVPFSKLVGHAELGSEA